MGILGILVVVPVPASLAEHEDHMDEKKDIGGIAAEQTKTCQVRKQATNSSKLMTSPP